MRALAVVVLLLGLISSAVAAEQLELSGRVIDARTSEPLKGLKVTAGSGVRSSNATTDAEGTFQLSAPAGSAVGIRVQQAGADYLLDERFQNASAYYNVQKLTAPKTDITLKVRLRQLSPLKGKVVDADGNPVAAIPVSVDARLPVVVTKSDGTFHIAKAPLDRPGVALSFNSDLGGHAAYQAGQSELTIRVLPKQERECIITTDDGAPVPNLPLTFNVAGPTGRNISSALFAKTDGEGKCRLPLFPKMHYGISWPANPAGGAGSAVIRPSDNTDEPVLLTVPQFNKKLVLRFTDSAGAPLPAVMLQLPGFWNLVSPQSRGQFSQLKSDADGKIEIHGLTKGRLQFMAHVQQGSYRQAQFTVSTDAGEATFALRKRQEPAQYTVRVVDSDGNVVPEAEVSLFTKSGGGPADLEDLTTDNNGTVIVTVPDEAQAAFLCDDPDRGWGAVFVASYQDGMVELPLRLPGTPLDIQLIDAQKKPVAGAKVKLTSLAASTDNPTNLEQPLPTFLDEELLTYYGLMQVTGVDGRAIFPRVDAELTGGISIESAEYGNQFRRLLAGGPHVFELLKLASLSGTLTMKDRERRPAGIQLILRADDGRGMGAGVRGDGTFEFRDLQPGDYSLGMYVQGGEMQKYKLPQTWLQLAPGEKRTLNIELQPGIPVRGKFDAKVDGRRPKLLLQDEGGASQPIQVNDDGTFELWVSAPGSYQLMYESQPNSYKPFPEPIDIKDRNPVEGLELKAP